MVTIRIQKGAAFFNFLKPFEPDKHPEYTSSVIRQDLEVKSSFFHVPSFQNTGKLLFAKLFMVAIQKYCIVEPSD